MIRIVIGTIKVLILLGIIESIAPGLSHDVAKQLVISAFGGK